MYAYFYASVREFLDVRGEGGREVVINMASGAIHSATALFVQ